MTKELRRSGWREHGMTLSFCDVGQQLGSTPPTHTHTRALGLGLREHALGLADLQSEGLHPLPQPLSWAPGPDHYRDHVHQVAREGRQV